MEASHKICIPGDLWALMEACCHKICIAQSGPMVRGTPLERPFLGPLAPCVAPCSCMLQVEDYSLMRGLRLLCMTGTPGLAACGQDRAWTAGYVTAPQEPYHGDTGGGHQRTPRDWKRGQF